MSKADLKAAMDSLQVKKPLRLPASAPAFRAPPSLSQDASTSPVPDTSKIASQHSEQKTSQDTKASQVLIDSQDVDAAISEDIDASKVEAASLVPRASQPRRATEQDRAVTEAVSVKSKLSTGYTRVPNSVLMEMVSGDLSRNEMKIMLLIARMTISFNRSHVPLSKGVIERMTGVQGRSVLDAMQSLVEAGLIEKVPGNHKTPNRLRLIFEPLPVANATQGPNETKDAKISQGQGATSTYKKDNSETIDLRKKISLSSLSENLRKYFADLKPRRKREAEFEAFEELRTEFSEEQIEECFAILQARGLPGTGAVCHSPMAYLSKAIAQVLPEVQMRKKRAMSEDKRVRELAVAEKRRTILQTIEATEVEQRERAFQRAFPTDQAKTEVFERFKGRFPMLTNSGAVFRNLVINEWWESQGKIENK